MVLGKELALVLMNCRHCVEIRRRCAVMLRQYFGLSTVLAAAILAAPARADVLDIAPGGALTVYSGPNIFTTEGVQPIATARPSSKFAAFRFQHGDVGSLLTSAAGHYAIRPELLKSVAWQESHFRNDAVSPKGAVGVMQLMPKTAHLLGVDPHDLSGNIMGGAAYLRQMLNRFGGDEALALAAYDAGPGAVERAGGIPQIFETKNYVNSILSPTFPFSQASSFVLSLDR